VYSVINHNRTNVISFRKGLN